MVRFVCKHTRERKRKSEPVIGVPLYCLRCHKDVPIEAVFEEYHLVCGGCRYGRLFGQGRVEAGIKGTNHARKNPDHPITLYLGEQVVRRWKPELHQIFTKILPPDTSNGLDLPPF